MTERETSESPIDGNLISQDFIMDKVVVKVEKDGEVWYETYEFVEAEKVNDEK